MRRMRIELPLTGLVTVGGQPPIEENDTFEDPPDLVRRTSGSAGSSTSTFERREVTSIDFSAPATQASRVSGFTPLPMGGGAVQG